MIKRILQKIIYKIYLNNNRFCINWILVNLFQKPMIHNLLKKFGISGGLNKNFIKSNRIFFKNNQEIRYLS